MSEPVERSVWDKRVRLEAFVVVVLMDMEEEEDKVQG